MYKLAVLQLNNILTFCCTLSFLRKLKQKKTNKFLSELYYVKWGHVQTDIFPKNKMKSME